MTTTTTTTNNNNNNNNNNSNNNNDDNNLGVNLKTRKNWVDVQWGKVLSHRVKDPL